MGRKAIFTDAQLQDMSSRAARGESLRSIARAMECSESAVRSNIKNRKISHEAAAISLAHAQLKIETFPPSAQVLILNRAEQIKKVTLLMTEAAERFASAASQIALVTNNHAKNINPLNPFERDGELFKEIMSMARTANELSIIPFNSLKIAQTARQDDGDDLPPEPYKVEFITIDASADSSK